MAYNFPEGSKFYFSSTFAAEKTITDISNATDALATAAGHGYSDNDPILLTSGWEDATDTVFQVDQQSADTFKLMGLDTTDTDFFPAAAGAGTAKKISGWVEIPQVLTIATSGGDARFTSINPLARRNGIQVPTGFNPTTITLTLGHDPSNANYKTMLGLSRTLTKVAFKMVLSGGAVTYGYGHMSVSEMPGMNNNQPNTVTAAFGLLGRSISYEA